MYESNGISEALFSAWKEIGKEHTVQVLGWSMRPFIAYGDSVLIKYAEDMIHPGEVVAYRRGRRIIVHRVVRVHKTEHGTYYLTRGDANRRMDPLVRQHEILGRVHMVLKPGGKSFHLESMGWRLIGRFVVLWVFIARRLPRFITGDRTRHIMGRVFSRVLTAA
jgi:signal peptidase I